VQFGGVLKDLNQKPIVRVTFALYKDQQGGAPLWLETQNITPDEAGRYEVLLGATRSEGLPKELFASGEARWLGVQAEGQAEQRRVLLLSVPYAVKAEDAATIGGLPPSAFVLATAPQGTSSGEISAALGASAITPNLAGSGTLDFVPLWTNSSTLGNSVLFQSGTGSTAKIGINTTAPAATLDVKGGAKVGGLLSLPATASATAAAGKNSQALGLTASAYNSRTAAAVPQTFQWQAEPVGNNTAGAKGSLNLLFGAGSNTPAETGLKIANNGQITFAPGQTFPGGSGGTVTSVGLTAPSSDFTVSGSPVTSSGTLALKWKVAPTNVNTASAIIKRDAAGAFSAGEISAQSGNAGTAAVTGLNTGTGYGVHGSSSGGAGVWGESSGAGVDSYGVNGVTASPNAAGVAGINNGGGNGVYGTGVTGVAGVGTLGVFGEGPTGVYGLGSTGVGGVSYGPSGAANVGGSFTGYSPSTENANGTPGVLATGGDANQERP
jgi:hypothetical protein